MAKNIVKEIIIILLLILAVILILGVILYEYVPANKIIPEAVSYNTPENVREELASSESIDEQQMIMTYEITASDLKNYQRVNDYKAGKKNPFAATSTLTENSSTSNGTQTTGNTTNSSNSGNTTGSSQTSNEENNTGYFQDKGTK